LDLVNKNREDLRYRRYFPHGLRAVTEAEAREVEPQLVLGIIKTLDEDQSKPDFAPLHAEFRTKLQANIKSFTAVPDWRCFVVARNGFQCEFATNSR
jgi:ABC-type phosphate/phosphonate transport system substrate-binding protein